MFFILQNPCDKKEMTLDQTILRELLQGSHADYMEAFLDDIKSKSMKNVFMRTYPDIKDGIPLGSVEFVNEFLKQYRGIEKMNPIEIPVCLRTNEFLKRLYMIVPGSEVPKYGNWFIKDATHLKHFNHIGDPSELRKSGLINHEGLYVVSEVKPVKAEYRVYVVDGKIYAVSYYNGDPMVQPDMLLINKANHIYSLENDYPRSYTMDVMVNDEGTSIIEIHVMFACGLYTTVLGYDFLQAYKDAMRYTLQHNTPVVESKASIVASINN